MDEHFPEPNTKDLPRVEQAVARVYSELFPEGDARFVSRVFRWLQEVFSGSYAHYQPIDAKYHDLEHTLQGTLCFARLLRGYGKAGALPQLTQSAFELGLLAILLHDTGYLKKSDDRTGTGAKYTLVHVARSAEFASEFLLEKGYTPEKVCSVQNMIRCTGVNADLKSIPFQSELERRMGFALGTADLLGQMAARDYVEKLEKLSQEFEESNRFNGRSEGPGVFTSAADLREKTPAFWENYVLPKIRNDFSNLCLFLNDPYPNGRNVYLDCVRYNMDRLRAELNSSRDDSRASDVPSA
jgi:hypothetical protein